MAPALPPLPPQLRCGAASPPPLPPLASPDCLQLVGPALHALPAHRRLLQRGHHAAQELRRPADRQPHAARAVQGVPAAHEPRRVPGAHGAGVARRHRWESCPPRLVCCPWGANTCTGLPPLRADVESCTWVSRNALGQTTRELNFTLGTNEPYMFASPVGALSCVCSAACAPRWPAVLRKAPPVARHCMGAGTCEHLPACPPAHRLRHCASHHRARMHAPAAVPTRPPAPPRPPALALQPRRPERVRDGARL